MDLPSPFSQKGNISLLSCSQIGDESAMENTSWTSIALRNPLILDQILAQLDITELKKARLVCRSWREIGGSLLGKRTMLCISKLFYYDGCKLCVTPVASNLMRRITIPTHHKFDDSIPTRKKPNVIIKVFKDLAHQLQFTREIIFHVHQRKSENAFITGLRRNLKNIQHISLQVGWDRYKPSPSSGVSPAYTKNLAVLTKLTSINFVLGEIIDTYPAHSLLQFLIDSAPNLKYLKGRSWLYPSLERCKNLKMLHFQNTVPSTSPTDVNLIGAIKMLGHVKDSLIEMVLLCPNGRDTVVDMSQLNQSLDLPVMSKLTSLSIRPAAEFMFHDFFNEDYLPVLTTVLLQVKHTSDRLNVSAYLNLWKGHRGIKYFRLELEEEWQNVGANVIGRKIVRVFPSVTKFDLRAWLGEDIVIQAIEQMMTPYQKWELEDVSVTGDHVTKSSVLVAVLKNVVRWKGAKHVHFEDTLVQQREFSLHIHELISNSEGCTGVKICGGYNRSVQEMLQLLGPIFEGSGTPIRMYGECGSHTGRTPCLLKSLL
ncbi:uncharacterized protein LOC110862746 [Folsomia candida]|uniref:uncharacterized protein LOC110862746 n=1 Tax=Folsomia candida TaxID=158441 RepID=UPI001604C33A|nr:uncharacterized protein LOC110862746 [Folsomia candida]